MMDPNKINRPVATVNRDAWFLRFYLWLWAADVEKVDFCRLFWGYVFAVPFFLVRFLILVPLFAIGDFLLYMKRDGVFKILDGIEWFFAHTLFIPIKWAYRGLLKIIPEGKPDKERRPYRSLALAPMGPMRPYKERKPSKIVTFFKSMRENGGEAFLASVGKTADKGVEVAQRTWPYAKWIFIAIGALIAGVLAAFCGYLIWLLIGVMPVVLGALGVALSAAVNGVVWFITTIFSSQFIWIVPLALIALVSVGVLGAAIANSRPVKSAGKKTADKTLNFGGAMKMGVKSVKYRTCPVIKVESE